MISFMSDSLFMTHFAFFMKYSRSENSVFVSMTSVSSTVTIMFFVSIRIFQKSISFVLLRDSFLHLVRFMTAAIRATSSREENGFET